MLLNGSQIFVEVLCEQGVDTIFGYPGGAVLNLYDELYKNADRIQHVLTAHEQGASHAADGYARATGRTGVVLATSGPGATNLVTGIATAYMDSVPMVAFTGNVSTDLLGRDSFQEAYIEGITMPITKHNFTVRRVEDLADTMRAAFRIAQSGRKGPVLVDIPKDVTSNKCEFTHRQPEPIRTVTTFDEQEVSWAAEIINGAQRPLVYFGGGVRSAASCQPLRDLIHKAGIPATYTLMGAGVVPYGDPLNIGMIGMHGCYTANRAVSEATWWWPSAPAFRTGWPQAQHLCPKGHHHPDRHRPQRGQQKRGGGSVGVGDAAYILQAMLPMIEPAQHPEWMAQIQNWQSHDYHPVSDASRLMPHQVIGEICSQCGPDTVYVTDVGQHQMWAAQYLHHARSRGFITSGGLGTMGFGYGRRHRRTDGPRAGPAGGDAHRRWLVPHEPERSLHRRQLQPAHHHGHLQQPGPGHGAPVADRFLRQPLFPDRPPPQDQLCQAGRGLWPQGLPLREPGPVPAGFCAGFAE